MRFSTLEEIPTSRDMLDVFGGYNHNLRINDGEFYDEKNMSSDEYPILSNRKRRGVFQFPEQEGTSHHINGMISKDSLCYIDGTKLYINGNEITNFDLEDGPKQLVSMGGYIVIFPDAKYVNTVNPEDRGSLGAKKRLPANSLQPGDDQTVSVSFKYCNYDGSDLVIKSAGETAPETPADKEYWLDTSNNGFVLMQYSATSSMWINVVTTYIKISATGIGASFADGDGVTISGIPDNSQGLEKLNNTSVIQAIDDNWIVLIGMMNTNDEQTVEFSDEAPFIVERRVPIMDYVCECGNRLWGCRYGEDLDGQIVNEIYASKLGDFKNFFCYNGITTGSYYASCGTDGEWTGAINFLGQPLFFKENCYHKVYGSYPSQFSIIDATCRGVQKGSSRSLAIVNETLFYKSANGVMAFAGSLPAEISTQLGNVRYTNAVAGAHDGKYYISMKDSANVYHLFVYDTEKGIWHKEDNTQVSYFCSSRHANQAINDTEMYMAVPIEEDGTYADVVYSLIHGDNSTEKVSWYVETGVIGLTSVNKKYVQRIDIRLSQELGSTIRISAQYDSCGEFVHICTITGTKLGSFAMPIRPKRCDHMRIRIEGVGDAKIYSISKVLSEGSDI